MKTKGIRYQASAIAAGMMAGNEGVEKPFIRFSTDGGEFVWYGYLGNEKGKDFAIKAALASGFVGDNWKEFAEGMKYFMPNVKCSITVVEEEWKGKTLKKVKWVNHLGSDKPMESMNKAQVKSDDSAIFKQTKQKLGIKDTKPTTDDVPF